MSDGVDVVLIIHVYPKCLRGGGFMITKVARVCFDAQMHSFDVPIQIGGQECFVITEFTCETRLDLQMDHFAMSF